MKKLMITCLMSIGLLTANAQESPGTLSVTAQDNYGEGQPIVVTGEYASTGAPGTDLVEHTWKMYASDNDGNIEGDAIYSITNPGSPMGDFMFPGSETLPAERHYIITLSGQTSALTANTVISPNVGVFVTIYTLTANSFYPCGQNVTATGGFFASPASTASLPPMGYSWEVFNCNAAGVHQFSFPFYSQTFQLALPATYTFNTSNQWACNQYYDIVLTFYNLSNNTVMATRSKVMYYGDGQINANNGFCAGSWITASGNYYQASTGFAATNHTWSLTPCNAAGQPTGGLIQASLSPTLTGTPTAGGYNAPLYFYQNSWTYTSAGNYYLMQLNFYNNSLLLTTISKVIYISAAPIPVITGPTTVCGTGTFCETAVGGTGNTYGWLQALSMGAGIPGSTNSSCVTVPYPSPFSSVAVTVINQYGCSGQQSFPVTNDYADPDFTVATSPNGSGVFKIQAYRVGNVSNASSETFKVEQYNPSNPSQYANTALTNTLWNSISNPNNVPVTFFGYVATTWGGAVISVAGSGFGTFLNGNYYKITHTVYGQNGCTSVMSKVVDQNGVCLTCRSGEFETTNLGANTSNLFDVFPNPSNGNFTIQFAATTDNAQAELFNMVGERVDAFTVSGETFTYTPAQTLAPGIYLLRIANNGTVLSKRVVVE